MRPEQKPEALSRVSDRELTAEVVQLARSAREATASLIAHLAEFEARGLHLAAGFSSLFVYCVQVLRLSEHEAYNRIEASRVARKYPAVLDLLGAGELNLTSVRLLSPHLTESNHLALLGEAAGKSKHEVQEVIARHFPQPDVASSMRKIPSRHERGDRSFNAVRHCGDAEREVSEHGSPRAPVFAASGAGGDDSGGASGPRPLILAAPVAPPRPTRQDLLRPLSPERYEVRFTAPAETCEKLRLAKDLLRHVNPAGDTAEIVDRALTLLLADLARKKFAATSRPRPARGVTSGKRTIPAAVKRAVWLRDLGRCAFVGASRRRCQERGFLEFHHVRPYAVGGEPIIDNIQVRCRAHNAYEADLFYSRLVPERALPERNAAQGDVSS